MSINLQKGQKVNLEKNGQSVQNFVVGMGWDVNETDSGLDFDLDASAFLLSENGKVLTSSHFVYYNNLTSPEGCAEHTGDNLSGAGDGDDESIKIDLSKAPANLSAITFVVTIHDAENRRQNFGQVRNAFVRVYDPSNNGEILKFDLGEDFSIETAVEFGRIYKKD
jgi:tellurium resistance protein TerD